MIEWLLNRGTIISLAVLGGACSLLASWCSSRNLLSEQYVVRLSQAAYLLMAVSMILFIAAGVFGSASQD